MKRERLLHLHYCLADQWKVLRRLLAIDPQLADIYSFQATQIEKHLGLPMQKASALASYLQKTSPFFCVQQLQDEHVFYMTIWDDDYPSLLRQIPDPPFILYGKGKKEILQSTKKLAVVGTRNPSLYGKGSIQSILQPLMSDEWLIVSGLANGIDTIAHEIAVEHHFATIAVLGHGLQYMYPKKNQDFYEKWKAQILLVTEYPPHYAPQKWYFPRRNRIVSGLCQGVLVVEAKVRSGSLITVDYALEQNREVFAMPGPNYIESAVGTNQLIQQGAKLVQCAEDVMEELSNYNMNPF
ncbi:DNA-processing protein DprA [Bacillus cereus group sp. BfR-BA-01380]|uniref:DNA-processing protein DprA n=1 Tax=Bacillus cereus group sp. BfR-BA-01380 TaxID=2920324 RepID=UPI001F581740|nr:DNA-processing protein DprA [Bacillus cereus group sp. BfR-BA-01380]